MTEVLDPTGEPVAVECDDPDRVCHIILGEDPIAVCGYDTTGRVPHSTASCVIEGHSRCFECARLDRGGVEHFLHSFDDSPF